MHHSEVIFIRETIPDMPLEFSQDNKIVSTNKIRIEKRTNDKGRDRNYKTSLYKLMNQSLQLISFSEAYRILLTPGG